MSSSIRELDALGMHPFTSQVFEAARPFADRTEDADVDEYEYYALACGHSLAHLLSACGQVIQLRFYLTGFRLPPRLKRTGATRAEQLVLVVEDFLIRTQTVYDRALALVDSVFHIGNPPRFVSHALIAGNAHIKSSKVLPSLNALNKLVAPHRADRNRVIHRESLQNRELRLLELLEIVLKTTNLSKEERIRYIRRKTLLVRQVCRSRTKEFRNFAEQLVDRLSRLFAALQPVHASWLPKLRT
jgi:hypothetical protein